MGNAPQPHRRKIVHAPPPAQVNRYGGSGSYSPPGQPRYDVADILQNPLVAVAIANAGPRPSPRYGSSARVRPLQGVERGLRDAATQYGQKGQTALSTVARAGYTVVNALDNVAGPVIGIVGGVAVASLGGIIPMESDSVHDTELGKAVEKVAKEVPDKIVKEPEKVVEKEKPVKTEVQEYKAPEKMEPVKTVAKGRGRAATEFFTGAAQAQSYVSAVKGGNADGSFDPSDKAQVQQVGPIAQYLSEVFSSFNNPDPQNGIFVEHWWSMQGQMRDNVTSPGQGCLPIGENNDRQIGAQIALQDIAALKALAGKAGLNINNTPAQKPGSYVGGFGWEVAKIIAKNEAAIQKALNQQCTVDKSEAALSPENVQPGVDTLGKFANVIEGFRQWVDQEGTGLGPVSPWVAGNAGLGKVYPGTPQRAAALALKDGVGSAERYNDPDLALDQSSPGWAGLFPFDHPPVISNLRAGTAYLGMEVPLTGHIKDPDGKGITNTQVMTGDWEDSIQTPGGADFDFHYKITPEKLVLGRNSLQINAGDGAWSASAGIDVEVTDPLPIMDIWSSSVEKVSDGLYKVYVSAFLADDNNNIESARAVDVNGSGFNVPMEKTDVTKLENGKTFVRYEGSMNVRLKNPGDSKDLSLQLRYKDITNPEVQAPNIEKVKLVYPKPEPPNPINNGTPGNNGTPNNNTTVPPIVNTGDDPTEPQKDYRGWFAALVAAAGGGGTAIWQRSRIAAALGMGNRNNGNGAGYAPLGAGSPADTIRYIAYMGSGGRTMVSEPTTRGKDLLGTTSKIDPDLAGGMAKAILDAMGQALGGDAEKAVVNITGVGTARYMRGLNGDVLCIVTEPGPHEAEIENRMSRALRDVAGLVPEIKEWDGDIKDSDPLTGESKFSPVVMRVRDVLRARIIQGEDPLLSMPVPSQVSPAPAPSGLLDAQGEAERPAAAGEIQFEPPERALPKAVEPAEGFGPPARGGSPRFGESYGTVEPAPAPTPTFVMPSGPDVPAPAQDSGALRRSIESGMHVPDAAPEVGMYPGVPGNGVTANGNGNGEPVDTEQILRNLGLGKEKSGAGK